MAESAWHWNGYKYLYTVHVYIIYTICIYMYISRAQLTFFLRVWPAPFYGSNLPKCGSFSVIIQVFPKIGVPSTFGNTHIYIYYYMYMHVLPTCNSDLVHQDLFQKKNSWKLSTQEVMILLMAEILHQLIGSFSHYLQGFIHPRWCRISAINSRSW